MSDAITLDVLSSSPVQLDVGDADPIAREEIAALAGRVTTVEGDVSGLSTRMGAVEGDISTLGTTVDGIDARVEAIEADYVTSEDVMDALGGEAPALVAGSSRAVLGDADTESWMERTTAADGAALIESVKGNTLLWNQLTGTSPDEVTKQITGIFTTPCAYICNVGKKAGHKYLCSLEAKVSAPSTMTFEMYLSDDHVETVVSQRVTETTSYVRRAYIFTATQDYATSNFGYRNFTYVEGEDVSLSTRNGFCVDLTAMFGAGNEPATVTEFEAMFPEPYYPYDAGSLLPVRMEGIETVGFNQWDEQWEVGGINGTTGENDNGSVLTRIRSKNFIPVFPSTEYYARITANATYCAFYYYDADKAFISNQWFNNANPVTTPSNCRYIRFSTDDNYGKVYKHDICINISDPARNGTYEPYWSSQRAIPAATYFPDGMRSAGTVHDELSETQAITRVGERAYQSGDESDASVITDGTVTHYALATPTTTPIDPPLPMSYKVAQGGTERVMVASGTTSAPPIFATRYPLDPADLAASIAPVDGPIAKTNHQVGDLIMLGFTLCKATQVIVTGETIAIGTNVTRTSVAAELAALSQ